MTRLLLIAAVVTVAGPALPAQKESAPDPAFRAFNAFGLDLYRRLVRDAPDKDLLLSPYSVAAVLAMAAEGARDETAAEIVRVLRLPAETRTAAVHASLGALERRFRTAAPESDPEQSKKRARLAELSQRNKKLEAEAAAMRKNLTKGSELPYLRLNVEKSELEEEIRALESGLRSYRLRTASTIRCDRGFPLEPAFAKTIRTAYGEDRIVGADFRSDPAGAIRHINSWVARQTAGAIPRLVDGGSISKDTRVVLLNAIHLRADWLTPFPKKATSDGDFTTAGGGKRTLPMMKLEFVEKCRYGAFLADGTPFATPARRLVDPKQQQEPLYPGPGGFQVLELPYQGRDLAMILVVPIDAGGLSAVEATLTGDRLDRCLANLATRESHVTMPRFEAASRHRLREPLTALGMARAFDPERAAFDGMTTSRAAGERLFLSAVVHEARIRVDESGSEASAATAGVFQIGALWPKDEPFVPRVTADRPFAYLIREAKSGLVLFVGRKAE